MRTKSLVLAAAALTAGLLSASAEVYSLNIVGYVNLPMLPGFNMVANQLKTGTNGLPEVFPSPVNEAQVLKYVAGNYKADIFFDGVWYDYDTSEVSSTTVSPGEGFFFFNPASTNVNVTLVGEVMTGTNVVTLTPGYKLVSSVPPVGVALTPANGFNPVDEMQVLTYNAATQLYNNASLYFEGAWYDYVTSDPISAPTMTVGQGFFVFNPQGSSLSWTNIINP